MKHIAIFITLGVLAAALLVGMIGSKALAASEPVIWYKNTAEECFAESVDNAFDYTELSKQIPETPASERNQLLALSDEQINSMTTAELLVTCLDYPLFFYIVFYDTDKEGFEAIVDQYNGLQALLEREDLGNVLAKFYSAVDLNDVIKTDRPGTFRLRYLELIILSDGVLDSMDSDARKELFKACITNCGNISRKYSSELSSYQTSRIAGNILYLDSPEFKELADSNRSIKDFLDGSGYAAECSEDVLAQAAKCVEALEK